MKNNEKELEEREIMTTEEDMDENNNESREFYVYEHIRIDNNTCFYVGKGKGNRAYNLDRGNFHNNVRDEHGCRVEIIKDGLTEEEAFKLETERIEDYVITFGYGISIDGYRDFSNNYLTNFTWGGEGASGRHHSEESKLKTSESMKGKNKGKHHSKEYKKNMSESMKGKMVGEKNGMWGKPAPNRIKVICITTGETFDSIKDASDHYKAAISNISACCRGRLKSAGKLNGIKLQWKYSEDDVNESKVV